MKLEERRKLLSTKTFFFAHRAFQAKTPDESCEQNYLWEKKTQYPIAKHWLLARVIIKETAKNPRKKIITTYISENNFHFKTHSTQMRNLALHYLRHP